MRAICLLAMAALLAACGSGNGGSERFAIYDYEAASAAKNGERHVVRCSGALCPQGAGPRIVLHGAPILTESDVAHARTGKDPLFPRRAAVLVDFTKHGRETLRRTTKAMAKRGRSLDYAQHLLVTFEGHVVGRVPVDYLAEPNGFDAADGLELVPLAPKRARAMTRALRR